MASTSTMGRAWGRDGLSRGVEALATAEPLGFSAADMNLFRYVGNDPADSIDPDGLAELPTIGETRIFLAGSCTVQKLWDDSFEKDINGKWKADYEEGGWIFYNPDTKEYELKIAGPERHIPGGHIDLSNPPAASPGFTQVGDFHTHPFPGGGVIGASEGDKANRFRRGDYPGYIVKRANYCKPGDLERYDIQPYNGFGRITGKGLSKRPWSNTRR